MGRDEGGGEVEGREVGEGVVEHIEDNEDTVCTNDRAVSPTACRTPSESSEVILPALLLTAENESKAVTHPTHTQETERRRKELI